MTAEQGAPGIAYLLTAAMAGKRYEEACAVWRDLDESAQCDVIAALASQARLAVQEAGAPLHVDFTGLTDTSCPEAFTAAQSAYADSGPWQPPRCPHCRELVASALAEIQMRAGVAAGMPAAYVDLICQGKAVCGAALSSSLLEKAGHPPVGERLATGLTGGAVLECRVSE